MTLSFDRLIQGRSLSAWDRRSVPPALCTGDRCDEPPLARRQILPGLAGSVQRREALKELTRAVAVDRRGSRRHLRPRRVA
jgi:hypothetical protein